MFRVPVTCVLYKIETTRTSGSTSLTFPTSNHTTLLFTFSPCYLFKTNQKDVWHYRPIYNDSEFRIFIHVLLDFSVTTDSKQSFWFTRLIVYCIGLRAEYTNRKYDICISRSLKTDSQLSVVEQRKTRLDSKETVSQGIVTEISENSNYDYKTSILPFSISGSGSIAMWLILLPVLSLTTSLLQYR